MLFKKNEVDKVLKQYGENKGMLFLTLYYTYMKKVIPFMKTGRSDEAGQVTSQYVKILKHKYGMPFVLEYDPFFQANLRNLKLYGELEKAGDKYFDSSLFEQN